MPNASVRRAVALNDNSTNQLATINFVTDHLQDLAGDIAIITTSKNSASDTCATPTGFTLLSGPDDDASPFNMRSYVFAKKLVAGDVSSDTTFAITWNNGGRRTDTAQVIKDTTAQVSDIIVGTYVTAAAATINAPIITIPSPGIGNAVLSYQIVARLAAASQVTITPPAGVTEGAQCNTNIASSPNYAGSTNRANTNITTAGFYGGVTFTATAGATNMGAYTFAIPTTGHLPPDVVVGNDQTVDHEAIVTVPVTSIAYHNSATFTSANWVKTAGGSLSFTGDQTSLTFTAPGGSGSPTVYTFRLDITDSLGAVGSDSVTITVNADVDDDGLQVWVVNSGATKTEMDCYLNSAGTLVRLATDVP